MPLLYRPDLILATESDLRYLNEENLKMRTSEYVQTTYSRSPMTASKVSYDSCSTSPTASPRLHFGYQGDLVGLSPRPMLVQLPLQHPGPCLSLHSYNRPHHSNSLGMPGRDPATAARSSSGTSTAHQISTGNTQTLKRAYRQRRKDPSCDACRERKVKCDATETASCSECSSRNVKCQFTKETNRRMSSIKQVQDLEKQITQIKRENYQLKCMLRMRDENLDFHSERPQESPVLLPEIGSQPRSRLRPLLLQEFSTARLNIHRYGKGIFKPPPSDRKVTSHAHSNHTLPELPSKHISDQFLHSYYGSIHLAMPFLHWPTFEREYETVYRNGNLYGTSPVWCSLFFAVLAVGCLFCTELLTHSPQKAREYIEISQMLTDNLNDEFNIDHVRVALLTSIFLMEMNLKSAAWIWIASAARISQDIGLHIESGSWSVVDSEMRRRMWWAVYIWDRYLSLELSRPYLIDDADCDVNLPVNCDDYDIQDTGMSSPSEGSPTANMILPIIHVSRAISQLIKTLRSPIIPDHTLRAFDTHFTACMAAFPSSFRLNSQEPLDQRVLVPICYLMNARLILHRHNLTLACPLQTRANALEQCIRASLDSSFLISRAMAWSTSSQATGLAAHAMICILIWRCTLFLLYGGHYDAALSCIRASSRIGTLRDINVSCSRNVAFFLSTLIEKRRSGSLIGSKDYRNQRPLDEELIAYISGDLQAHPNNSWVWHSSESRPIVLQGNENDDTRSDPTMQDPGVLENGTGLETETRDWGGWRKIEYLVEILARESDESTPTTQLRYALNPAEAKLTQERLKSNERMSITNII